MIVSDGHKGLAKAREAWPEAKVQRCTQHKWTNLKTHCPVHAHAELKRGWDAIVRADDGLEARAAYRAFVGKWTKLVPAVVHSLEEAGLELLTFYSLPKSMWKSLRSRYDRSTDRSEEAPLTFPQESEHIQPLRRDVLGRVRSFGAGQ